MGASGKKKAAVLGVSSILLVAAVVGAVTFGFGNHGSGSSNPSSTTQVSTSSKAVDSLCQHTDYKETCQQSLNGANSTDPKELIKHAFSVAITNIGDVISKSSVIQAASKDPMTSQAFDTCKEVLNNAVFDFERSIEKISDFDVKNFDEHLDDLKTWLSAANTVHETCLDAFENTTGDAGEKMKELLKTAGELSSNGLAMVSDISKIFSSLNIPGFSRRLMSDETYPEYIAASTRRLMDAGPGGLKPNAVVALDGSGQFKSIMEAVNTVPKKNNVPFVIFIKAGIYKEYVQLPKHVNKIILIGEGPTKTKITGNKNYIDGVGTFQTATLSVNSDGCILRDLAIENSAGAAKHQAVALRVSGDQTIVFNCQLDGYQDTLYTHTYRQFYRDTVISGTIDFIFGDGQAVFQNCKMVVRKPLDNQGCMVTAQGRKESRGTGAIVLQNCKIAADPAFLATNPLPKAYLGRPWKEFSRTIVMQSDIDAFIAPEGFSPWMGTFALDTLYYAEYQNRGPGADTSKRVPWKGIQKITPQIANSFTPGPYIQGQTWVPQAGVLFQPGMMKV